MGDHGATKSIRRIAMLGNHLPRQCGIATFTTDLAEALARARPRTDCFVLAVNDAGRRHAYPPRVQFEINRERHSHIAFRQPRLEPGIQPGREEQA